MATKESIARKLVSAITRGKAPAKKQAKARADQATPLLKARRAGKEATPAMLQKAAKDNLFLHIHPSQPISEE